MVFPDFPMPNSHAKWLLLQAELLGKSQDLHRLPSQRRRPCGLVQVAVDPALRLAVAEPGPEATAHAGLHLDISASEQKSHWKVGQIMENHENPIENWKNHGFFTNPIAQRWRWTKSDEIYAFWLRHKERERERERNINTYISKFALNMLNPNSN